MDPAQALLDALEGAWRGPGSVTMPNAPPTAFDEVITFTRRSETSLDYSQRAVSTAGGEMLHAEVGIWRLGAPGHLEITVALPGSTEIAEGAVVDGSIQTESTSIGRAATSHKFRQARRHYRLDGDTLVYDTELASVAFPLFSHVTAVLRRG